MPLVPIGDDMVRVSGEVLAAEAAKGSEWAFNMLWARHEERLLRTARASLWHDAQRLLDPEDILQDAWIAARRSIVERRHFRPTHAGSALHYLRGICRKCALTHMRSWARFRQRFRDVDPDELAVAPLGSPHDDPATAAALHECADVLEALVARLPDEEREAYELVTLQEKNTQLVAARLGVTRRTVQRHVKAAKTRLRRWGRALGYGDAA